MPITKNNYKTSIFDITNHNVSTFDDVLLYCNTVTKANESMFFDSEGRFHKPSYKDVLLVKEISKKLLDHNVKINDISVDPMGGFGLYVKCKCHRDESWIPISNGTFSYYDGICSYIFSLIKI